ncbi:MAG: hypothetical protein KAS71_06020 [Bacteroidales bacterium]|nr:hypothetical protein [Bacteroidales bacterium]
MGTPQIFIITGAIEGGKSIFLNDLSEFLRLFEKSICGFISRGQFTEEGNKDFILKDLSTEKETHLASRLELPGYFNFGKFYFNPTAIKKGNKIIQKAIDSQSKILIIDEIGPLELSEEVWHESLIEVLNNYRGILIFSTRKRLIEGVISKFEIHEAFIEDIESTSARKTGESILSLLKSKEESQFRVKNQ